MIEFRVVHLHEDGEWWANSVPLDEDTAITHAADVAFGFHPKVPEAAGEVVDVRLQKRSVVDGEPGKWRPYGDD